MIYTRLFGGAGNQLFQYAAGRALADHLGTDLALDRRYVQRADKTRADCFEHYTGARFVDDADLPPAKFDGFLRYGMWRRFGRRPRFQREESLGFNAGFFGLPDDTYLHGYWQSEKYFGPEFDRLRTELQLTTPLDAANQEMADQITETKTSVAVHVRRGDYLGDAAYAACSEAYYVSAVERLKQELGKPLTCFVFSNDPGWARENLKLGTDTVVVDLNDETRGHFDLHLQSLCDHKIIANSTFSWWGAWLNETPQTRVIAPKAWFGAAQASNPDICPDRWIRL